MTGLGAIAILVVGVLGAIVIGIPLFLLVAAYLGWLIDWSIERERLAKGKAVW